MMTFDLPLSDDEHIAKVRHAVEAYASLLERMPPVETMTPYERQLTRRVFRQMQELQRLLERELHASAETPRERLRAMAWRLRQRRRARA